MANTRIQLHSSGTTTNQPSLGVLANGEIALNFADGIIYYKTDANALGEIKTTTPSGLDTEIQFNDGGDFGANSGLTFTKGTGTLAVGTALTVNSVNIPGRLDSAYIHANAAFAAANSGGITGFTSADNTSSPNDTVNAASLTVDSSSTNADIVLEPKGTGAFLSHIPGGDAATGNKRGAFAIDLQLNRTDGTPDAADVPSTYMGTIIGGYGNYITNTDTATTGSTSSDVFNNTIIGARDSYITSNTSGAQVIDSVIIGGLLNSIRNDNSDDGLQCGIVGGNACHIQGSFRSFMGGGQNNKISQGADYGALIGGNLNNIYGGYSGILAGRQNTVDADSFASTINGGQFNETEGDWTFIGGGYNHFIDDPAQYTAIVGGYDHEIDGDYSFMGGGYTNIMSSSNASKSAIIGGESNVINQTHGAIAGGQSSSISGTHDFIGGGQSHTLGNSTHNAVVGGQSHFIANGISHAAGIGGQSNNIWASRGAGVGGNSNFVTGDGGVVIGGANGYNNYRNGTVVIPGHYNTAIGDGDAQQVYMTLYAETTDATATTPTSENTTTAATDNIPVLENNSAFYFRVSLIAGVTGAGNTKSWTFEGVIKRGASASTTAFVGTPVKNVIAYDTGASAWDADVSADTTLGALKLTCTGQASTTIRWVAKIETTEMSF